MRNWLTSCIRISLIPVQPSSYSHCPTRLVRLMVVTFAGLALGIANPGSWVRAEDAASAPPELKETLRNIDAAANSRNLDQVLGFYAPNFSSSDGLSRQGLKTTLAEFWKMHSQLTYQTQLLSWKVEGSVIVAETMTRIQGSRQLGDRTFKLEANLKSRQRIENQQIVRQDILAERSQLTAGLKPPTVDVNLPEEVKTGQSYSYDAIVREPLGDEFLLGAVTEEPVRADRYFSPVSSKLEPLSAGGIFKLGRAPASADQRWISAILVREGGITVVNQRLRVVERSK